MSEKHVHPGYIANKAPLQARLKRIEGQVRGIQGMVEDERYCIDILTQISAISSALDAVAVKVLNDHVEHCVAHAFSSGDPAEAKVKSRELIEAVERFARTR